VRPVKALRQEKLISTEPQTPPYNTPRYRCEKSERATGEEEEEEDGDRSQMIDFNTQFDEYNLK
jgi:hypothetical protein